MNRSLRAVFAIVFSIAMSSLAYGQFPAKGYDVISYTATVKLDRQSDSLWGVVTMTGRTSRRLDGPLQFAYFINIDSVLLNGKPGVQLQTADSDFTWGGYKIGAADSLLLDSNVIFTATTYYHGKGLPEAQGTMHWGGVTDNDSMMFAMGVGFNAPYTSTTRHWLPCYDKPDDKADSVDLTFMTSGEPVASNGLLITDKSTDQTRAIHWHVSHPIATYLLTFATGPYVKQDIPNMLNKPFEVYSLRRDSAKASVDMRIRTANVLAFYDSLFGKYPFEKVGYVVTPIGSMEHQTMISLDGRALVGDSSNLVRNTSATTAVHELAHMWWGDWVTCRTFDDAWLNEGFATFCESLALEHLFGHAQYLNRQHSNIASAKGLAEDTLPLFGAATVDQHTNNYPGAIYNKGAAVLGMLRQHLGDSIFFAAVRYYGNRHAYSTATSTDLESDFERVSGQDLSWFWNQWIYHRGHARDTVVWMPLAKDAIVGVRQVFDTIGKQYYRIPIPMHFASKSGQTWDQIVWMDSAASTDTKVTLGFTPDTVKVDPEGLMLMTTVKVTQLPSSGVAPQHDEVRSLVANPNPNNRDVLTCHLIDSKEGAISYSLIDTNGRTIRKWDCRDETLHELLTIRGIPSGNYRLIALFKSGDTVSTSVTIQH